MGKQQQPRKLNSQKFVLIKNQPWVITLKVHMRALRRWHSKSTFVRYPRIQSVFSYSTPSRSSCAIQPHESVVVGLDCFCQLNFSWQLNFREQPSPKEISTQEKFCAYGIALKHFQCHKVYTQYGNKLKDFLEGYGQNIISTGMATGAKLLETDAQLIQYQRCLGLPFDFPCNNALSTF